MKEVSKTVSEIEPPASVEIANEATERQREGEDIVNLGWGEPDFRTPEPVREALFDAVREGHTGYTESSGIPALRERLAAKFSEENDIETAPSEIIVTPGAKQAIFITLRTLVNPSDEVIVPDPGWTSYEKIISLAGATPVPVSGEVGNRFIPAPREVADAVTDNTKAIIINTPSNPTGAVWTRAELETIAEIAERNDLYIVSDEVYEKYTFDDRNHVSIGSISPARDRTITVNGFSKSHAMTGWRIGYLGTTEELQLEILTVQQHINTCAPSFVQHAGVTAADSNGHLDRVVDQYESNRDELAEGLPLDVVKPEGAFYTLIDVSPVCGDDVRVAARILDETGVAVTPGSTYGETGRGYVRVSLAKSESRFRDAVSRIRDWYRSEVRPR